MNSNIFIPAKLPKFRIYAAGVILGQINLSEPVVTVLNNASLNSLATVTVRYVW